MRKCLQQRRQKHTEGVSAGPSDQKQDEKQAGDDEPCPTFMLSHCYLRQIVARRVRPSCSTCTGFRLCHPRSASVRGQIHAHSTSDSAPRARRTVPPPLELPHFC